MSETEQGQPEAQPAPVVESRIEAVVLTVVSTTYRDGKPVAEQHSQPVKVFLAAQPALAEALAVVFGRG